MSLAAPPNTEIHPFQDGNGRLSRVLTTLLLLRAGYAYVPYSSLEAVIEQNKQSYYLSLRQTQGTISTDTPAWQPWVLFFLRSLASQVMRLEEKVTHEKLVLAALPALSLLIIDLAKSLSPHPPPFEIIKKASLPKGRLAFS
jgi:hypothetical protein